MSDQARFDPANRPIGAPHHPKLGGFQSDRDVINIAERTQGLVDSDISLKYLFSLPDPARKELFGALTPLKVSDEIPEGSKRLSQKTKHVASHFLNRPNAPKAPNLGNHR